MNRILIIFFTVLSLILFANCKDKKKETKSLQAGIVTFSKGENKLKSKDGKEKPIQLDTLFFQDDTIITGKTGIVDIQLVDGIIIRIKQSSELKLSEILVEDNGNKIKTRLDLKSGKVFTKTSKKLNPDSSFVIATPTFVAGVRGTEFLVEDGEGNDQTLVSEGAVNIEILDENGNPTGKESVIEKGKKGVIENNLILNKDLSIEDLAELSEDSQSIASISEQARARMQEILQTVQDQKQINREIFEEQMQKNRTELNDLKDKNQQLLNDAKEENKQLLNENTEKAKQNKDEVKDNSKVQTDEIKDKGSSEIDEMKNKNKIDKSQVAPK